MRHKILQGIAILLCLFLASCTKAAQNSTFTLLPPSSTITRTASTTPQLPIATPAVSPTAENSATPTPTLTVDPSTIPSPFPTLGPMTLWKDGQSGFGILYPADWKPAQPDTPGAVRYAGESGYFELKGIFQGDMRQADRDCTLELFKNPDGRYGADLAKATFYQNSEDGSQISFCVVAPKPDLELHPEMFYVSILSKTPVLGYAVIERYGIGAGRVQVQHIEPEVTPTPPPPLPTTDPGKPVLTKFDGFVMKAWAVAPQTNANDAMYFQSFSPDNAVTHPMYVAHNDYADQVKTINAGLAAYGYRVEAVCENACAYPKYRLYQGSTILKDNLDYVGNFSASADKSNFSFGVTDSEYQTWLLTNTGLELYATLDVHHSTFPMYAGSHLITLNGRWDVIVESDGQTVFTGPTSSLMAGPEVDHFFSFDGHWALEIQGAFIVDGEIWNITRFPADEIFETHMIDGKLFFFFRRGGQIGIYYDGKTYPTGYSLIHHYGCCGNAAHNPRFSSQGIYFYAIKDGMWNFVEIQKVR